MKLDCFKYRDQNMYITICMVKLFWVERHDIKQIVIFVCDFLKPLIKKRFILKYVSVQEVLCYFRDPVTITHVCAQQHGSKQVVQSKVRTEFKTFDRGRVRCPEKKAARVRAGAGEGAHWVIWSGSYWWIMSGCGGEVQTHTHVFIHMSILYRHLTYACLCTCCLIIM